MGDRRTKSSRKQQIRKGFPLTQVFETMCPIYIQYGMTYEQFWYGDMSAAYYYRKAYELKMDAQDQVCWLQGSYVYQAIGSLVPVLQAFAKAGTRANPYVAEPYTTTARKEQEMLDEQVDQELLENERLAFIAKMDRFTRETNRQFKEKDLSRKDDHGKINN